MTSNPDRPRLDPSPAFREAIDRLADEAREQDRRADEENRKAKKGNKYFPAIIAGGSILIIAQGGLLAYLTYGRKETVLPAKAGVERPILPANSCAAVVNKTYWRILAFKKDKGRLPARLDDLLGKYIETIPADPVSGKTLAYSVEGDRFTLRCPTTAR